MPVKVSFRAGNRTGLGKLSADDGLKRFTDALGEDLVRRAAKVGSVDVQPLQQRLEQAVTRQLRDAVNFAAMNMVGLRSSVNQFKGAAPNTEIYFDTGSDEEGSIPRPRTDAAYLRRNRTRLKGAEKLEWQALKRDTIYKKFYGERVGRGARNTTRTPKMSREDARRFFVETGALRSDLKKLAQTITQSTGTIRLGYIKEKALKFNKLDASKRTAPITIGQLEITFLPQLKLRTLPGLRTGRVDQFDPSMAFEKTLGLSSETLAKLRGPDVTGQITHRPLLQPVITYWTLFKIPNAINSVIARSLKGR